MTTPLCKTCKDPVSRFIKSTNRYWDWCSNKCMGADPEILEKKKNTNLTKFGVSHPMQLTETRDKLKASNLKKHGYENPFKDSAVKQQIKNTHIKNYGVDNPSKNKKVIEKIRDSAIARYAESKEDIINKRRNTYIKKIGFTSNKHTHIPRESIQLMKNVEWLTDQHFNQKKSCQQIADELGVSPTPILKFLSINNIDVKRHQVSKIERDISDFVKTLTNEELILNDRTILTPREIDIYIPSIKLGIEVNGVYWHSEEHGKDNLYHIRKTKAAETQGIRLIQIYDTEWNDPVKQEIIKSKLRHIFDKSIRLYARKCVIKDVTIKQAEEFLNENHLQGSVNSKIKTGLFFNDQLVALATLGISRYNKSYQFELLRYCNKTNHSVVGGLSKLLKYIVDVHKINSIISYADRRWTSNLKSNLYESTGFAFLQEAKPNYKYFKIKDSNIVLLSRNQFQKHMLEQKLEFFDIMLTEYENMNANGYFRIWDCGNLVYTWKKNNNEKQTTN